jgi:MoxR-like ATPase
VIDLLIVALLTPGHVLLEDVPGLGKTMLAKSLARSLACSFQRVQFTPDLLPSDITGVSIFNQKTQEFEYRAGPLMTQIVLADEINRAGPRTQSALLEAMEERQVTVDGITRPTPRPFLVLATQNPIELEGTFPLPEAQLDRFLLRVAVGYPEAEEEREVLRRFREADPLKGRNRRRRRSGVEAESGVPHRVHQPGDRDLHPVTGARHARARRVGTGSQPARLAGFITDHASVGGDARPIVCDPR